jgi:cold shock CspA family protein
MPVSSSPSDTFLAHQERIKGVHPFEGRSLDNFLADEEEELHPRPVASVPGPSNSAESLGIVKWYNTTKGFGFVTPEAGGEVFLHRTVLEQAGLSDLEEGTRVRVRIVEGKKGPQVDTIALA